MRELAKQVAQGVALALVFVPAALSGFGRWQGMFALFAQCYAVAPGLLGDYLRSAYYRLTLIRFGANSRISFGSFFAYSAASVGSRVYIGAYSVLGHTDIGNNCQIASAVQILSGGRQHRRDADGRLSGSIAERFTTVRIGADCWIGAAAIIMADVGERCTIGAGAVVTRPVPEGSTAVGVPARVLSLQREDVASGRTS
jgi:acetyltransferase-like isoleucine patch superfamily enzyme